MKWTIFNFKMRISKGFWERPKGTIVQKVELKIKKVEQKVALELPFLICSVESDVKRFLRDHGELQI